VTRATVEDENGLVTVNSEIGGKADELALLFFQAMIGNGFHAHTVIIGMEAALEELTEAYEVH
jgi:hypothetical protein